jgi:hypothetical protein
MYGDCITGNLALSSFPAIQIPFFFICLVYLSLLDYLQIIIKKSGIIIFTGFMLLGYASSLQDVNDQMLE